MHSPYHMRSAEHGSVLVLALVFMLLLTMIGAGAMQSATLQERMAGGSRDTNTAFQAAEAALRAGETYLNGTVGTFTGTGGRYKLCKTTDTSTACSAPDWRTRGSTGWQTRPGTSLGLVYAAPQYIIEQITVRAEGGPVDSDYSGATPVNYYRVTARGFGPSDSSMVVLQSVYRKKLI